MREHWGWTDNAMIHLELYKLGRVWRRNVCENHALILLAMSWRQDYIPLTKHVRKLSPWAIRMECKSLPS